MPTATEEKEKNTEFFNSKLNELLQNPSFHYKFVVIHEQQIKNAFDTFSSALEFATANFPPEEFVVQQVIAEDEQINFLKLAL